MKKSILCLLLLLLFLRAPSCWASITINGSPTNVTDSGATPGTTFTLSPPSTTGNLYVVCVTGADSGKTSTSVTDNKSNTYTAVDTNATDANSGDSRIYYAKAPTTGVTTVTVNVSGSGAHWSATFYDLSGADTTAPLEAHAILSNQSATTNPVGPSITPATNGGFVVAACAPQNQITAVAGPFTGDVINGANVGSEIAHNLYSTAGNFNPSWTQNTSGTWDAAIAAFKPSGGATSVCANSMTLIGVGCR